MTPANYGTRALAYMLDILFVVAPGAAAVIFGIGALFTEATRGAGVVLIILGILWVLIAGLYNDVWRQGKTGSTFGKKRMGVKLVKSATGEPVGFWFALVRILAVWFFNALSFGLYILADLLAPAFTERRQRITDKMLSAEVVEIGSLSTPPPPPLPGSYSW